MNSAVGRCWGKARTVRFPTQSTNRTETWFAVVAYTEQLGENSAGRGTVLLVCVTEGCGPGGPIPPRALQAWTWACSDHGRRNRLHRGMRTRLPSLNKLFYTMYKEMQTVRPATAPMAPGDPWDASSPSGHEPPAPGGEERGPGPLRDMPPAAVCPRRGRGTDTRTCGKLGSCRARGIFSCPRRRPGPPQPFPGTNHQMPPFFRRPTRRC